MLPLLNLFYAYGNCEINYHADVGPGISILHSSLGNVVSGSSIIGSNLSLTGGNVIGIRGDAAGAKIIIGHNCQLGANAVIIGPVILGNDVIIGASACVVKNATDDAILVGVPAKNIAQKL